MTRMTAVAWRRALVPALATLFVALAPAMAGAQTGEPVEDEVEAKPAAESGGFTPPLFGSPDRLVGAGSRELGPSGQSADDPCAGPDEEAGGEAGESVATQDCLGASDEPAEGGDQPDGAGTAAQ